MARTFTVVLLLAVAATIAFLISRPDSAPVFGPDQPTQDIERQAGPSPAEPRAGEVGGPDAVPTERRAVEAATPDGARAALTGKLVRVVDAATGGPVANATVWCLQQADLEGPAWNAIRAGDDDPMGLLETYGQPCAVTGPRGEARIPVLAEDSSALVAAADPLGVAATPQRAGWAFVRANTSEPIVLAIGAQQTLNVAVRDARDQPATDVALRLAVRRDGRWTSAWRGVTDDDGSARILQVGQRARVAAGERPGPALLFVDALLGVRPRAEIDLTNVPADPVVLTLPDTGSVIVVVDSPDPSRLEGVTAHLQELGLPLDEDALAERVDGEVVDGRASFARVGLGLRLRATISVPGANEDRVVEADGPRVPGQEVLIRVPLVDDTLVLVARLVDADGEPLASEEFDVVSEATSGFSSTSSYMSVESDADGRVIFTPTDELGPDAKRALRFHSQQRGLSVAAEVPRPLQPGENDLGDLRMLPPPLLVSGRVVDDAGGPIERASLQLKFRKVYDPNREDGFYLEDVEGGSVQTDADGEFEIHGVADGTLFDLAAEAGGYLDETVQAIPRGSRGVVVTLSRAGAITGEILVPSLAAPMHLSVSATHAAFGGVESTSSDGGKFELESVRPGRVDVAVRLFGRVDPVAVIRNVVVTSGETTELEPIDLSSALRELTFRVVDQNGALIRDARALWLSDSGAAGARDEFGGVMTRDGLGELVVTAEPVDLFVYADHHRSRRVAAVRDGQDIALAPAPTLVVRVPPDVMPSGAYELRAEARFEDETFVRQVRYALRSRDSNHAMMGALPWSDRLKATVDAGGRARFELPEPGRYAISWSLRGTGPDGRSSKLGDAQDVLVGDGAGEQVVDATLTREQVETAVREGF